ncbi:MAG: LCP family protein [Coriobacteriia bacterium]|nr:LCP family protein [Coriobacteriia bacterium]
MTNQQTNESENHDELIRKRKRRRRKNYTLRRRLKKLGIVLGVIVGVVALIAIIMCILSALGRQNLKAPVHDEGKVVYYNGHKYNYNENIVSTLIIGYDQTEKDKYEGLSGQADFLLLMTLDTESGKLRGISIPRDTMIEVGEYAGAAFIEKNTKMQIAKSYGYGDGKEKSCEITANSVSRLLYNMPIKYYTALNLEGIGPLNDSIGGVYLNPIETIPNTSIYKGQNITLMGNNAKAYVRYRDKNDVESSEMRRARQVQYVNEFYHQAFKGANGLQTAIDLYNVASNYIITNLGLPEFTYYAQNVLNHGIGNFDIKSVPGQITQPDSLVEFNADQNQLYELVLDTFYIREN